MLHRQTLRRTFVLLLVVPLAVLGCKKSTKKDGGDSTPPLVDKSGPGSSGGDPRSKGRAGGGDVPAGWEEARDTVARFRLLMPGKTLFYPSYTGVPPQFQKLQMTSTSHGVKDIENDVRVKTISFIPPAGFKLGTTPEELYAAFSFFHPNYESLHTILEKAPVTLGGRPALKLYTRPIDLAAGTKLPEDPAFAKDEIERRKKRDAERVLYYVAVNGQRVIILSISSAGDPPPALVKTVTESFTYE
jgi:hypothetical protein